MHKLRIEWLDILKGLLLLFICLSHFGFNNPMLSFFISPTGGVWVPCFFFISGMLFNPDRYNTFTSYLRSKINSLILPYLLFIIIFTIADWNLYTDHNQWIAEFKTQFINTATVPKASPLWFVIVLFEVCLIYYVIQRSFESTIVKLIIIFGISFLGFYLNTKNIRLPFCVSTAFSTLIFYAIGHLLNNPIKQCLNYFIKRKPLAISLSLLMLFIMGITLKANDFPVLAQNKLHNYFLFFTSAFTGILGILFSTALVYELLLNTKFRFCFNVLRYIARNAMVILSCHVYIVILSTNLLTNFWESIPKPLLFFCNLVIVSCAIYFFVIPFIYHYFPAVFGKKKQLFKDFISLEI